MSSGGDIWRRLGQNLIRRRLGARKDGATEPAAIAGELSLRARFRPWLSPPLLAAVVAVLALGWLLADLLPGTGLPGTGLPDSGPKLASPAPAPPGEAGLEPEQAIPPIHVADWTPFLNEVEPAAGRPPDGADGGARPLPEIPEAPASLDDVARELRRRRAELVELEAGLRLREAATRAAEASLAAQLDRLEAYRLELAALLGQIDAQEEERLRQLVKMYESMRAKSAAAIFDRLDLPVIMAVAARMREAKMAAILAAMDPNRARLVTAELARERQLPKLE